jgi:WD40 repeat protein
MDVQLTFDGKHAVVLSMSENIIRVLALSDGTCLHELNCWSGVISIILLMDGLRLISLSEDNILRIWDLKSGECLRSLHSEEKSNMSDGRVTTDGRRAITVGLNDPIPRIWDLDNAICISSLEGHKRDIAGKALAIFGKAAATGSYDNTIRVWDIESGECFAIHSEASHFQAVEFAFGNTVCAGTANGSILFLEMRGIDWAADFFS